MLEISSFYTCVPKIIIKWCTVPEIQSEIDIIFCHLGSLSAFFTPLTTQKTKILKKMKKTPGDIIILYKCTINHDHILYCSWDMTCDRCDFNFSVWAIFCPLKKNETKHGDIIILHMCNKNYDRMMYGSWDMVHDRQTDGWKKWHIYRIGCPT